jgi:hypothetical protein
MVTKLIAKNYLPQQLEKQQLNSQFQRHNYVTATSNVQEMYWVMRSSGVPGEGGWGGGCSNPPPPNIPKFWQSSIWLQIERKMFSVHIPAS